MLSTKIRSAMRPLILLSFQCLSLLCVPSLGAAAEDASAPSLARIRAAAERRDAATVLDLCGQLLAAPVKEPEAYYWRGREQLRAGRAAEAVADFDAFLAVHPDAKPRLWERGIACYYAGKFSEGADQFAAYQTYDDNDVENAVWHIICLSRASSFAEAQRKLMKVRRDGRVPMMEIFDMFAGKLSPDDVLRAAEKAEGEPDEKKYHRFYARLYIGLYHEARGEEEAAKKYLTEAAESYPNEHYMWDVANMHARRWKQ